MQQSFINSTSFTIRINICLVRASQFLHQFCLLVKYKPRKEHIIPDVLNRFTRANNLGYSPFYLELNTLFVYYIILVKIHPNLIFHILKDYVANNWQARVQLQILNNKKLSTNEAILLFVTKKIRTSNTNSYFELKPNGFQATNINIVQTTIKKLTLCLSDKSKLIVYFNCLIGVRRFYIFLAIALEIIAIAYGKKHSNFFQYYKSIFRSQYI